MASLRMEPETEGQLELPFFHTERRRIGREEPNMVDWLVGVLDDRAPKGKDSVTYTDVISTPYFDGNTDPNRRKQLKRIWTIMVPQGWLLPAAMDRDILIALSTVDPVDPADPDVVEFSYYELAHIMHRVPNGRLHARLVQGVKRLMVTTIHADNAFFNTQHRTYETVITSIFQNVGVMPADSDRSQKSFITWSRCLRSQVRNSYFCNIDTTFYFSLRTPVEKRLFHALNRKRYGNERRGFPCELRKWAYEHIGISRNMTNIAQVKRVLDRGHETLRRRGFLADWDYVKNGSGEWKVEYRFANQLVLPPEPAQTEPAQGARERAHPLPPPSRQEREFDLIAREDAWYADNATDAEAAEAKRMVDEFVAENGLTANEHNPLYIATYKNRLRDIVDRRLRQKGV